MTQLILISFFSPVFYSFEFLSFCIFMISTIVLFGYLSYFTFLSKKQFLYDSPKNWKVSFISAVKNNKKDFLFFSFFLVIQLVYAYYFGDFLIRILIIFIIGIYFFYIKELPKVKEYLLKLKKDDYNFNNHWRKDKKIFKAKKAFYFFIFLLFTMLILKIKLMSNLSTTTTKEEVLLFQNLSYLIYLNIIVVCTLYMSISVYIIWFCNEPIWAKIWKTGKTGIQVALAGTLGLGWSTHIDALNSVGEPTRFTNIYHKYALDGWGFGIEPGNQQLKLQLYRLNNQATMRGNLTAFLAGRILTDDLLNGRAASASNAFTIITNSSSTW